MSDNANAPPSNNEALRTKPVNVKPKRKLVPAGSSKTAKKKNASPNEGKTKKRTKANVHKEFANETGREMTAADKKIIDMLNAYTETIGANAARAKVLEKLAASHSERSGKGKTKAFKAALEKLVGRKLTPADLELVTEGLENESEIAALADKIRYRPFKKPLGHSPTGDEIRRIKAYQMSNARTKAEGNAGKAMNKAFITLLKTKASAAGEITSAMTKARTARLARTKAEETAFDAKVTLEKTKAKEDLMAGRTKKGEPAAKDINALAKIRAHGMMLEAADYLLIQYDQDSESADEIIVDLQEQAKGISVCAECDVEELLKHI
jgi:hypothetical protein